MDKENVLVRIYELRDPRDTECKPRYVGITTKSLHYRLRMHINTSNSSKNNNYRVNWIRKLLKSNIIPTIHLIEEVFGWGYACECEKYWIKEFKEQGYKLTNSTLGGEGAFGIKLSKETRLKLRLKALNRVVSKETGEKISKSNKGRKNSKESIQKAVCSRSWYKHSQETKNKISIANKGRIRTEKTRMQMSASKKGNLHFKYLHNIDRELFIKYYENGMTGVEISKIFDISCSTVYRYLRDTKVVRKRTLKRKI